MTIWQLIKSIIYHLLLARLSPTSKTFRLRVHFQLLKDQSPRQRLLSSDQSNSLTNQPAGISILWLDFRHDSPKIIKKIIFTDKTEKFTQPVMVIVSILKPIMEVNQPVSVLKHVKLTPLPPKFVAY